MADVGIRSLVDQAIARRSESVGVSAERVLLELERLALFDIRKIFNSDGTLKRVIDLDDDTAAAIMSVEMVEIGTDGQLAISKKFKAADKKGALELMMRHKGMLTDKIELTMPTVRVTEPREVDQRSGRRLELQRDARTREDVAIAGAVFGVGATRGPRRHPHRPRRRRLPDLQEPPGSEGRDGQQQRCREHGAYADDLSASARDPHPQTATARRRHTMPTTGG